MGKTVPVEGEEDATELSIMQKLIMPAAEVLAMDATDFSCGDRLLKGLGKNVRTDCGVRGGVYFFTSWRAMPSAESCLSFTLTHQIYSVNRPRTQSPSRVLSYLILSYLVCTYHTNDACPPRTVVRQWKSSAVLL